MTMPEEHKQGLLSPRPLALYHERTRRRGVNSFVYWPMRAVLKPAILLYFRLRRLGREHIPSERSDPRRQPPQLPRPVRDRLLQPRGRSTSSPSRSCSATRCSAGSSTAWAPSRSAAASRTRSRSSTSLALLERGEAVVIFPEGTRIRAGSLAKPKRGVGRLALQSGAPVVPIAITGSRARPRRLEDQAGARARALRPRAHLPARGKPVAVPRRRGDRAHLALRRAPVGVARRPAAAAHGRGGRRRLDGHRDLLGARARRARGAARLPHDLAGRAAARRPRERRLPPGCGARQGDRAQDRARDRVRRRGPGRARRSLQQPARRDRRDRRAGGRAQRRAGRLEGARAAARHHAHAPTWPSACPRAPSPAWAAPRTRARRSRSAPRWWSPRATPTCAASCARCSTPAA